MVKIFLELFTGRVGVRFRGSEGLLVAWGLGMCPQRTKNDQKKAKSHFCRTQALPMGDSAEVKTLLELITSRAGVRVKG